MGRGFPVDRDVRLGRAMLDGLVSAGFLDSNEHSFLYQSFTKASTW